MLKIDVFSDIACPYCFIGKRHLTAALEQLEVEAEIHWRSYLINPGAPKATNLDRYDFLAQKYGRDREWAVALSNNMVEQGKRVGIEFNFDTNQPSNTFDAHRLLHLAKSFGLQSELKERFLNGYFRDGLLLADHQVLLNLALESGLPEQPVLEVLVSDQFVESVRTEQQQAESYGINSVPCFVFNQKQALLGAQPIETMKNCISSVLT